MIRTKNRMATVLWGLLAMTMVFISKGGPVHAAGDVIELDLRNGSVEIEENRYRQSDGTTAGEFQEGQDFIITSGGEATANSISVRSGEHNITFSDVHIISDNGGFGVVQSDEGDSATRVYLTVEGSNEIQSKCPVTVGTSGNGTNALLSITEESTGELALTGTAVNWISEGSAICVDGGTLEIHGGTVRAAGGFQSAGIKVAESSAGGDRLRITGGHVTAAGGDGAAGSAEIMERAAVISQLPAVMLRLPAEKVLCRQGQWALVPEPA